MRIAMTNADLKHMTCDVPGCAHNHPGGPLFLHSACHPSAATRVKYENGELEITCRKCNALVVTIKVAES